MRQLAAVLIFTIVAFVAAAAAPAKVSIAVRWSSTHVLGFGTTQGPRSLILPWGAANSSASTPMLYVVGSTNISDPMGVITALDAESGNVKWRFYNGANNSQHNSQSGLAWWRDRRHRSHDASKRLFQVVHNTDGFGTPPLESFFLSIDAVTGHVVGNVTVSHHTHADPAPLCVGDTVYFGTRQLIGVNAARPTRIVYESAVTPFDDVASLSGAAVHRKDAPPLLVYTWNANITAYDVSDPSAPTIAWSNTAQTPGGLPISGAPTVTPDQETVFAVQTASFDINNTEYMIAAINSTTGETSYTFNFSDAYASISFATNDRLILDRSRIVRAYDRAKGDRRWEYTPAEYVNDTILIAASCSLPLDRNGDNSTSDDEPVATMVVCAFANYNLKPSSSPPSLIVALDIRTGAELWKVATPFPDENIVVSNGWEPAVVARRSSSPNREVIGVDVYAGFTPYGWGARRVVKLEIRHDTETH